jgi:hypothetical protein
MQKMQGVLTQKRYKTSVLAKSELEKIRELYGVVKNGR